MQVMDSLARYGAVSRFFHWSIAALLLWQLAGMVAKVTLGRDAALTGFLSGSHQSLGFVIFVAVLLRALWALANLGRRPPHHHGLAGLAARAGHIALYALMLFVPGAALIRAYGNERAYNVFGWQVFPARPVGEAIEWMVGFGSNWHGLMGWTLGALILGHIVMAIWHMAVRRDGTMAKMAGEAT